jgi:hypothetical protein
MPGFIDDAALKETLRSVLSIDSFSPGTNWDELIHRANEFAVGEIRAALAARGYVGSQAASWDRAIEYQVDLAHWHAVVKGGVDENYNLEAISKFDRRSELKDVAILIGGSLQQPGSSVGVGGGIRSGALRNTSRENGDIFSMPRRGGW